MWYLGYVQDMRSILDSLTTLTKGYPMAKSKMGAGETSAQAPHQYINYRGGFNWEWFTYSTKSEAQEVLNWILSGSNDKWGHARTNWCGETTLHLHRNNTRRP